MTHGLPDWFLAILTTLSVSLPDAAAGAVAASRDARTIAMIDAGRAEMCTRGIAIGLPPVVGRAGARRIGAGRHGSCWGTGAGDDGPAQSSAPCARVAARVRPKAGTRMRRTGGPPTDRPSPCAPRLSTAR